MPTKKCTAFVKNGTEKLPCGTSYTYKSTDSSLCPNRENHILKMKTGFCASGWCEGINPKTKSGNPAPSCQFHLTCPCKCHDMIDKMFEIAQMERIAVDKSEYHVERTFWMPSDEPLAPLSSSQETTTPVLVESPAPDLVPPTLRRPFAPTTSGRAAPGELESWVKDACDVWLIDEEQFPCTPVWIADEIAKTQGIKPPSVGAITAVFNRWVNLGFAVVGKKPTRFLHYTEDGVRLGLDRMKQQAKRRQRARQSEKNRGLVR